jgi:hypothetical protein
MVPRIRLAVIVLFVAIVALAFPSAETDAASVPCSKVNAAGAYGSPTAAAVFSYVPDTFAIGDMLTVSHTGTATQVVLEVPQGNPVGIIPQGGALTYAIPSGGISDFRVFNATGMGTIAGRLACFGTGEGDDTRGEVPFLPGDDRINHHTADRAAPVAIYCRNGGIQAIRIDPITANGSDFVRVSPDELEAAGIPADGNIILARLDWIILARLADTRFSALAWYADGKPYTMTWVDCNDSDNIYLER